MASDRTKYHVVPDPQGGWEAREERSSEAVVQGDTKAEVLDEIRRIARGQEPSQVIVHGMDGTIQDESTYGDDPYPPEG